RLRDRRFSRLGIALASASAAIQRHHGGPRRRPSGPPRAAGERPRRAIVREDEGEQDRLRTERRRKERMEGGLRSRGVAAPRKRLHAGDVRSGREARAAVSTGGLAFRRGSRRSPPLSPANRSGRRLSPAAPPRTTFTLPIGG